MNRPLRISLALLTTLVGCRHPMQAAIDRDDGVGACRAYLDDDRRVRISEETIAEMDALIRRRLTVALHLAEVAPAALGEGIQDAALVVVPNRAFLYRVSVDVGAQAPVSNVTLEPPRLQLGPDVEQLRLQDAEYDKAPVPFTASGLGAQILEPAVPELELLPERYLPKRFLEETLPGKFAYRSKASAVQVMMFFMTAGLSALVDPPSVEEVPVAETKAEKAKRAAFEKEQRVKRAAAEKEEQALLDANKEAIEKILATNRERLATHARAVAAHKQVVARWVAALNADCAHDEKGRLKFAGPGRCAWTSWPRQLSEAQLSGVELVSRYQLGFRLSVELSDGTAPCTWSMDAALPLTGAGGGSWSQVLETLFKQGPVPLELRSNM